MTAEVTLLILRYAAQVNGLTDIALTKLGRKQSAVFAGRFQHQKLTAIYSSDLLRCRVAADQAYREADLAMTRLFGGFSPAFYAAYHEEFPLPDGHRERLPMYQLYHLLNHLNLFGSGYYASCERILEGFSK